MNASRVTLWRWPMAAATNTLLREELRTSKSTCGYRVVSHANTAWSGKNADRDRQYLMRNVTETNSEYRYGERRNNVPLIPTQVGLPRRKHLGNLPGRKRLNGLRSSGDLQELLWRVHLVKRLVGETNRAGSARRCSRESLMSKNG